MKKIIIASMLLVFCSGCSLIPHIKFGTPSTVPQNIDRSKAKEKCAGKAEWDENGRMISCSKGYYNYQEGYSKVERKMTIVEKIKDFINQLFGWGFWAIVLLIILCPSLLGMIAGRLIEGAVGITGKSLKSIVSAVQKARKQNVDLNTALATEMDKDTKKYVAQLKEKEGIK